MADAAFQHDGAVGFESLYVVVIDLSVIWGPNEMRFSAIFAIFCKYAYGPWVNDEELENMAHLLKALGEVNRLTLVCRLCECCSPQNAMCLCDCCSVDASGVSRHLKVLAQEGVVRVEKHGRERTYALNRQYVAGRLRGLADQIESATEVL